MLKYLLKYDLRATWRDFAGIYLSILLGVILVPFILNNFNNEILQITSGFFAFGIVIAVIVVTIMSLFKIFNANVFSKEGYLTMTLPVTSRQIVTSKLIVSSMWITLTGLVGLLGILVFVLMMRLENISLIWSMFQQVLGQINGMTGLTIFLLILAVISSAIKEVAKLFLACSIAHLKQLNKFRVPAGILSYFMFSWLEVLLAQGGVKLIGMVSERSRFIMEQLQAISDPTKLEEMLGVFNGMIGLGILYSILLVVAFSASTVWILNHKLDLD